MEELVQSLVEAARAQRMVATDTLQNKLHVLVYPRSDSVVVGIGYAPGTAQQRTIDAVLERRSRNLPRFGTWLPAVCGNGSMYVLRRIDNLDSEPRTPLLTNDELQAALELVV